MPITHVKDEDDFDDHLNKAQAGDRLVVVDFTAAWCGPCKFIAPFYETLSSNPAYAHGVFLKVDVDQCPDVSTAHNIRVMPTFVFLKSGREVGRLQGTNQEGLEDKVKELIGSPPSPFSGSGHRLGGAEGTSSSAESTGSKAKEQDPEESAELEEAAKATLNTDLSIPVTNVGVRLANGNKLTIKMNLAHSVIDLRNYICTAAPCYAGREFGLMTTFPNKEITDESATIEEANLAGAMVVQKLK